EIMAIGHNIEEALLKGIRSLEIGNGDLYLPYLENEAESNLLERIKNPDDERIFIITELLRRGVTMETIHAWTKMDYLFIQRIQHIIELEKVLKEAGLSRPILEKVQKYGFSDIQIARVLGKSALDVYNYRTQETVMPVYTKGDTCAGQFESAANYYDSTYDMGNEYADWYTQTVC